VLGLDASAPDFALEGIQGGRAGRWSLDDLRRSWAVLFFYPADFTFVCPTEMRSFQEHLPRFRERDCQVVAVGTDGLDSHRAWALELGGLDFPLLSDPTRAASRAYGVLGGDDRPWRATFVLSPGARVAHITVTPANVGRSVEETLRVLSALQTGRLCPAEWRPGQPTGPEAAAEAGVR